MKFKVAPDTNEDIQIHPEGTFDATIVSAVPQASRAGDPQIVVTWKTQHGKVKSWITYIAKYPHLFTRPLLALGIPKEAFDEEIELDDLAADLVKRHGVITVMHRESNQGNPMAGVEAVDPPGLGTRPDQDA